MFPFLDLLNWWSIESISMIGMKESEWIEIFPPTHDILNLEPCVWRPVWDKWRLVVPSCGAPSQNSGYLEWKVNDCQEAICRENWSNTWAIWKNKAHPRPKKKQSKLQSMSSRCNLWSSGTMVQTALAWLSKSLYFVSTKYLKQVWSEIEELSLKTIGLVVFHISATKRETMRVATWTARMTNCPISVIEWSRAFKLLWDLVRIIVTQVWTGHGAAVCGKIPPLCPFFAVRSLILFRLHAISLFGICLCISICICIFLSSEPHVALLH